MHGKITWVVVADGQRQCRGREMRGGVAACQKCPRQFGPTKPRLDLAPGECKGWKSACVVLPADGNGGRRRGVAIINFGKRQVKSRLGRQLARPGSQPIADDPEAAGLEKADRFRDILMGGQGLEAACSP